MAEEPPGLLNIGIVLSYSRLIILPVALVGVATGSAYVTAGAVLAAVLTDLADGGLARMLGQYTQFGKDFDSTVDFIFIHCLFIAFFATGRMETWQLVVIYAAMLATLTLQFAATARGETGVVRTTLGRPTGALEYAYLLLLVGIMLMPRLEPLRAVAFWLFALLTAAAGVYFVECVLRLAKGRNDNVHRHD